MRAAIIQVTCDLCGKKFDESEAANVVLTIRNAPPFELDACDECIETSSIVSAYQVARPVPQPKKPGRKPKPKEAADAGEPVRSIPCGVKGCTFMAKNAGSLSTHQARAHGMRKAAKS